jgi:hypothetical protein
MKQTFSIPDELLSAYIDRQVSEAELRRVEKALLAEPTLQQHLETMQATVALLNNAPTLAAPRAFVLSENQVLTAGGRVKRARQPSFWERWLPRLMPVATAFIAILFIFAFVTLPSQQVALKSVSLGDAASSVVTSQEAAVIVTEMPVATMDMQAMEKPAPRAVPSQARSLEETGKEKEAKSMNAATAKEPAVMQAQSAEEAAAATSDEAGPEGEKVVETPQETASQPSPAFTPPFDFSLITWLLGILLIIFIFLTWRVTFARSRKK